MDYNFVLAVYMIPGIVHFPGESGKKLSEKLLAAWKETFPSTNVQASDFETINAGFKRKYCYITTAVCETFGKPDNCYELNLFRTFRDTYLASSTEGEAVIDEYYKRGTHHCQAYQPPEGFQGDLPEDLGYLLRSLYAYD